MMISESMLRRIIREELLEASIRRPGGAPGTERRLEEPPNQGFKRRVVRSISDVVFNRKRGDDMPGSPFIGGSEAYEKTYNDGKLKIPLILSKWVGPRLEDFMIFVDAPIIREGDVVIVPELLETGELGAGIVTSESRIEYTTGDGREVGIPVASVQFRPEGRDSGSGGTIADIGRAFLVRIGSSKTDSGMEKLLQTNSIRRKNKERRSNEPEMKLAPREPEPSSRASHARQADYARELLGVKRR